MSEGRFNVNSFYVHGHHRYIYGNGEVRVRVSLIQPVAEARQAVALVPPTSSELQSTYL
jgi:hypothetical protein